MLEVLNVRKRYDKKEVLKGINFCLQEGTITSLIGNNGSGKTTTFKIICGLLTSDMGEIKLNNNKILLEDISYLNEQRSLYQDINVEEQLKLICRLNHFSTKEMNNSIDYYLHKFKMVDKKKTLISTLSKGNQQKVAIICSLIKEAKVLIMDEPFTGLDKDNIELLVDALLEYKRKRRIIIISSHIYQSINQICDNFLYLQEGIITKFITKEDIDNDTRKVIIVDENSEFAGKVFDLEIINEGKIKIIVNEEEFLSILERCVNTEKSFEVKNITIQEILEI